MRSYGMVCGNLIFHCCSLDLRLTAIQDRGSSSGNPEDVIVKSEVIETEMMPGTVMPFKSKFLRLNHYTHLIR